MQWVCRAFTSSITKSNTQAEALLHDRSAFLDLGGGGCESLGVLRGCYRSGLTHIFFPSAELLIIQSGNQNNQTAGAFAIVAKACAFQRQGAAVRDVCCRKQSIYFRASRSARPRLFRIIAAKFRVGGVG
jgi:hypothetical protein